MNKNVRMFLKVLFCVIGLFIIIYILAVSVRMGRIKQPEGEYIRLQDALLLSEALEVGDGAEAAFSALKGELSADSEAVLSYEQFLILFSAIVPQDAASAYEKEYEEKYREGFFFLKDDWYRLYDSLLTYYDMRERIVFDSVTILGTGQEVWDEKGNSLAEREMLTEKGKFSYASDSFSKYKYQAIKAYKKDEVFLTVYQVVSRGYSLHNVWIVEAQDSILSVFVQGYEIELPYGKAEQAQREQIADMEFADGSLQSVKIKNEKINGKLLSFGDGSIEIEGYGKYPYEEGLKVYKLYGMLSECGQEDLRIGYNFTDFVLEDGVICAGLITRDEAMENIRVLIKNTNFGSVYHEKLELTADTDFVVSYGNYDDLKREEHKAGEKIVIGGDSEYFTGERAYIEPTALTGRIQLLSVDRAQGTPAYRGKLEISHTQDGLVVVNEVLLEEYLYSVVPSEMPASYPLEALKAQAICARTYAYRHMSHSGVAQFGAHVDDSAGYQVYNNIAENAQTTKAVKETTGELLFYGEELCGSYYYSTSCGFGSDSNIWKSDSGEDTSYLVAKRIGEDGDEYSGEEMTKEEVFDSFIGQSFDSDYEREEAWYRWSYKVEHADSEKILASIQKRYEANEKLVLTKEKDGSFTSEPVKKLGEIKNIYIEKRNSGGAADELIVEGTKKTYKIISEHNIRYVLSDGESMVVRQDGSEVASPSLLPSAYMTIMTSKEEGVVVGYTLAGGGYGHGVGMSQNGAKAMAAKGFDAQGILSFFYQTCEIKNAY
jgi:stage II sporulation protein D